MKNKKSNNNKRIKKMKKNLILINIARGGIVNEIDLTKALKEKIIAGAGIDVATSEPKKSHAYYSILNKQNFIWTPHTVRHQMKPCKKQSIN